MPMSFPSPPGRTPRRSPRDKSRPMRKRRRRLRSYYRAHPSAAKPSASLPDSHLRKSGPTRARPAKRRRTDPARSAAPSSPSAASWSSWTIGGLRSWLERAGRLPEAKQLDRIASRGYGGRAHDMKLLERLDEHSCLGLVLDFVDARGLARVMRCARRFRCAVRRYSSFRILRLVGNPSLPYRPHATIPYSPGVPRADSLSVQLRLKLASGQTEKVFGLSTSELRQMLRMRGKSQHGGKPELVKRLITAATSTFPLEKRSLKYLWQREGLTPFFVGQWIDAKDTANHWLEAQVVAVDGTDIAIHYKGWKGKYDEWFDLSLGSPDWDRVALPLRAFRPTSTRSGGLAPGSRARRDFVQWLRAGAKYGFGGLARILVSDTTEAWVLARVIGYRAWPPNCEQVRVTYQGWSVKFDEWIDLNSYRLDILQSCGSNADGGVGSAPVDVSGAV